jgi:hypothetical protein
MRRRRYNKPNGIRGIQQVIIGRGQQILGKSGTYTGDGSVNKAVPHGLGRVPKMLIITQPGVVNVFFCVKDAIVFFGFAEEAVTAMDATNFYVGNAGSLPFSANVNATNYLWSVY